MHQNSHARVTGFSDQFSNSPRYPYLRSSPRGATLSAKFLARAACYLWWTVWVAIDCLPLASAPLQMFPAKGFISPTGARMICQVHRPACNTRVSRVVLRCRAMRCVLNSHRRGESTRFSSPLRTCQNAEWQAPMALVSLFPRHLNLARN